MLFEAAKRRKIITSTALGCTGLNILSPAAVTGYSTSIPTLESRILAASSAADRLFTFVYQLNMKPLEHIFIQY
jgi:hypothetical protein